MTKPAVTIIMRTKNSDWVVGWALASLFSQEYKNFELLVVDSGSTDKTLDIVARYPHELIKIEPGSYYPGAVLNAAIKKAQGQIVVFLNSDTVLLHPQALANLLVPFSDEDVHATYARQIPRPEAVAWVKRDYAVSFPEKGPAPLWITLSLPFAAMRKDTWKKHNFYTQAWASEDTEWGHWAKNEGLKIEYAADSLVMHSHNYTLKQLYGRRFVEGEADAFIYNDQDRINKMLKRIASSVVKDTLYHAKNFDFGELLKMPLRRGVYHWAYYKGHILGEKRKKEGNTDASTGQKVVLSRYETPSTKS